MIYMWITCCLILMACGSESQIQTIDQDLGEISVQVPSSWITEQPSSSMRKAQYRLPKQAGDSEDALLVVFYFGPGQGGTVSANLERWFGQFNQPDGRPSREAATVSEKTLAGMKVTLADVSGTYAPSAMGPMAPAAAAKPDFRMLTAIVETVKGPYFFKLTGPAATVAIRHEEFSVFVNSVRP